MKLLILLFIVILFISSAVSQTDTSLVVTSTSTRKGDTWFKSRYIKESLVPISLAVGSGIIHILGL